MSGKKWWEPKNKKPGVLGVLHAVKNIFVEGLRIVLTKLGLNKQLGEKDLARRIIDTLVIILGIFAIIWLIGVISGNPVGGPVIQWWNK